jgi:hypothetical protein
MSTLQRIQEMFGNLDNLVEVANRCDKAYAEGTGNPDWHAPFGTDQPEQVAQNIAGLQAVASGIGVIATMRGATSPADVDAKACEVLSDIVNGRLSAQEHSVVLRLANTAWGAGQPFRTDKGPLGRATRLNMFDLLDPAEVSKDYHQIKAAATWLQEKLGVSEPVG